MSRGGPHDAADGLDDRFQRDVSMTSCFRPAGVRRLLGALVVFRDLPLRGDPALLLQAMHAGTGPPFDVEVFVGPRADGEPDPMAVLRPPFQRSEDHHVERALQQTDGAFATGPLALHVEDNLHPKASDCLLPQTRCSDGGVRTVAADLKGPHYFEGLGRGTAVTPLSRPK